MTDDPVNVVGRVLSVRGSQASLGLAEPSWSEPDERRATVGRFIGIRGGSRLVVGVITDASIQSLPIAREQGFNVTAIVDLMGEIRDAGTPAARFSRGVTNYPAIGDAASAITPDDLKVIYEVGGTDAIRIGTLQHGAGLPAYVNLDEMLSKHFAMLGTTGVGKSSGVAVILREILERRPDLRIFLVDPHNEYGRCFGDRALTLTPANLRLPFWLFNFEEIVDVLYRGRPTIDEEVEVLAEMIPTARRIYGASNREIPAIRKGDPRAAFTVDTPVPYRIADVMALIDDRMGRLDSRVPRVVFSRLLARIDSVVADPRYAFMFENANVGGDTMSAILKGLFRLPTDGKPMTIMQLAGFPTEVVDVVVSVLGRMAFDFGLWSDGKLPLLFVCEEAHRYAAADANVGFGPTRRAIARIAKEGRKYGVFLALVTQRPAELDPTIISQCSTLFAMRMSNERDQALVRSAVSDAAANLLGFLPSLGTREVFAFGEGVAIPTRLAFSELPPKYLPHSEAVANSATDFGRSVDQEFIDAVVDRWRSATLSSRVKADLPQERSPTLAPKAEAPDPERRTRLDPDRYKLLKKAAGIR